MAQHMQKYIGFIEMQDGTEFGPIRIGLKTKMQTERSTKANNWSTSNDVSTINAFMCWYAGKEAGEFDMSWDEFLAQVFDANTVELEAPEKTTDAEDPTRPAATAG